MKLLRILLILLLWCVFISASKANIYIDVNGAFTQTGDTKNQFGGGIGFLYSLQKDINIFFKSIYNTMIYDYDTTSEARYDHLMNLGGIEYLYNINNMPLFWKNSIGIGFGRTVVNFKDQSLNSFDSSDSGVCAAIWTGLEYIITQSLATFIDIGFHRSVYLKQLEDADIMGVQVLLGIRVTAYGKNRSIYGEY